METTRNHNLLLLSTTDREHLVHTTAAALEQILGEEVNYELLDYAFFANGEADLELQNSVRGKHVYGFVDVNSKSVHNDYQPSLNDRYMFGKLMLDTAKANGAKTINVVYPSFPYARADKPTHYGNRERARRKPSSARRTVVETEALGIDRCITLDIHNPATMEIFRTSKAIDLPTGWLISQSLQRLNKDPSNIVFSGADQGGDKKISAIAKDLGLPHAVAIKKQDYSKQNADTVEEIFVIGDITDRDVVIHDDMLDTGGTFIKLLEAIHTYKPRSVSAVFTHFMANGPARERLDVAYAKGLFEKIIVTDSIYHDDYPPYVEVVGTGSFFADKIGSIAKGESMHYNRIPDLVTV